jgi:cytochrome c556
MNGLNPRAWLAAGAVAAMTAAVFAHGGATGIVGERMMGMMMLSEQIKLLTPALSGGSNATPSTLKEAAGMIKMHAGSAMTNLFPEGSIEAPSEARAEIWARWSEFTDYADRLAVLATELEQSADVAVAPARATLVEGDTASLLSEWDTLDFETLMGLPKMQMHDGHQMGTDPVVVGSVENSASAGMARQPAEIFADITATCSSCHAAFRR